MAGWLAEVNASLSAMEGRVLFEDDSHEEPLPFDFSDVLKFVRSTGRRILDTANSRLLQGPVAECLAPSPFPQPDRKITQRPIIGVVGSDKHEYAHMCEPLGQWIAQQGFHLLTFQDHGVSHAVARAFALSRHREGCSLGLEPVMSNTTERPFSEYVEVPLRVPADTLHSGTLAPRSIFFHTAHVVVVLPGAPDSHLGDSPDTPSLYWQDGDERAASARGLRRVKQFSEVAQYITHVLRRSEAVGVTASLSEAREEVDEFEMLDPGDT